MPPNQTTIDIVFDGPPGPVAGRFIETETPDGKGVGLGEWIDRGDGTWALRLLVPSETIRTAGHAPKTEVFYCWMVPVRFEDEAGERLITPRSDGFKYEVPADLLFDTVEDALAWREEELEDLEGDDPNDPDAAEVAYIRSWVLCRRTLEVVEQ